MQVKFRNQPKVCLCCKREFIDKWGDRREHRSKKYCSKECRSKSTSKTLDQKFSPFILPKDSNGCIEWVGFIHKSGYGAINWKPAGHKAHRAAWIMKYGSIKKGEFLLHNCDNPRCVNVEHLRLGTAKENANDMVLRNRQSKGTHRWKAKLNPEIVNEIRTHFAKNKSKLSYYTNKYNVSPATVSEVINRRIWKHVK